MKIKIQVKSDFIDGGFHEYPAIYNDYDGSLKIVWKERIEDDDEESIFELTYDKDNREVVLVRKGGIRSKLVFCEGKVTEGVISSKYGSFPLEIETKSISMPNKVVSNIKIEYNVVGADSNVFEALLVF